MKLLSLLQGLIAIALAGPVTPSDEPTLDPVACQQLFLDEVRAIGDHFMPWSLLGDVTYFYNAVTVLVRIDVRGNVSLPMAHLGLRPDAIDVPPALSAIHDGAAYAVVRGYVPSLMAAAEELERRYGGPRLSFRIVGAPSNANDYLHLPVPTESIAAHAPDALARIQTTRDVTLVDYQTGRFAVATRGLDKLSKATLARFEITWLPEGSDLAALFESGDARRALALEKSTLLTLAAHRHLKAFEPRAIDPRLHSLVKPVPHLTGDLPAQLKQLIGHVDPNSAWSIGSFLRRVQHEEGVDDASALDVVWRSWEELAPHRSPVALWRQVAAVMGRLPGKLSDVEHGSEETKAKLIAIWKPMAEDAAFAAAHPELSPFDESLPEKDGLSILLYLDRKSPETSSLQEAFEQLYRDEFGETAPDFQLEASVVDDAVWNPEAPSQIKLLDAMETYLRRAAEGAKSAPADTAWIAKIGAEASARDVVTGLGNHLGHNTKAPGKLALAFDAIFAKFAPEHRRVKREGPEALRVSDGKNGFYGTGSSARRIEMHWREFYEAVFESASKAPAETVTAPADEALPSPDAASPSRANAHAWIDDLGPEPSRESLVAALVGHARLSTTPRALDRSFVRLWQTVPGVQTPTEFGLLQTDGAAVLGGDPPGATGRLRNAWTKFWTAREAARGRTTQGPAEDAKATAVNPYRDAHARLRTVTPPGFEDLTPPDQIVANDRLKQVLESLGRAFELDPEGVYAGGFVHALFVNLYAHYYPTSSERSITSLVAGAGIHENAFELLAEPSVGVADQPAFNLYASYYAARKLQAFRDRGEISFDHLPDPETITDPAQLKHVLSRLASELRLTDFSKSGGYVVLFETLFARACPEMSQRQIHDRVAGFKIRATEHTALKKIPTVGPGVPAFDAYRALFEARNRPPATNPAVTTMIREMASLFGTTVEALLAPEDDHVHEWFAIDETTPLFALSVGLLRSLLDDPHSEAAERIASTWEKDKESILADQRSRARIAVSFANIEPYQVKQMAKVLGARYDVGQTKATFKELWAKFLPPSREAALTEVLGRLKVQNADLAEAGRQVRVPPAVFRRLRQIWAVFVAEIRRDQQLITPPAMELPDPNDVTDARALVETLAGNIGFALPDSNQPIVDLFRALFLDLRLDPNDLNVDGLLRARVAPDDLARVSAEPRGPAFRRIVGLYRIYFERVTGDVDASATGKDKPPRDLSLPIETSPLGSLVQSDMRLALESYETTVAWSAENGVARNLEVLLERFAGHPRLDFAREELASIAFTPFEYGLLQKHDRAAFSRLRKAWRVLQLLVEPREIRSPIDVDSVRRTRRALDQVLKPRVTAG